MKSMHRKTARLLACFAMTFVAGCFGPNEMNPVCWLPIPGWESSRLEAGQERLRPLQAALEAYYARHGTYPLNLEDLTLSPAEASISRLSPGKNRYYSYCGPHSSERICLRLYYQNDVRVVDATVFNLNCVTQDRWWSNLAVNCPEKYHAYSLETHLGVYCPPHLIAVFARHGEKPEWKLRYITGK